MTEQTEKRISKRGRVEEGRPRKYKCVEDMQKVIEDYFHKCFNRFTDKVTSSGEIVSIPNPAPRHIQGLCVHLDMCRETLLEYEKLPEFSDAVKGAKRKCESYAVDQCFEGQKGNKADFILKNGYGWADRSIIDQTTTTKVIRDDIK